MKCEITNDGFIKIQAETNAEKYALIHLIPLKHWDHCGMCSVPLLMVTEPIATTPERTSEVTPSPHQRDDGVTQNG